MAELGDYFEVERVIGKGSFGLVLLVRDRESEEVFAAKAMYLDQKDITKQIEAEKSMTDCKKVKSPYLIKYYDFITCEDEGCCYIIMEYCSGGDLRKLIYDCCKRGEVLTYSFLMKIIAECLLGLYVLHRAYIIHRDIKPENIFVIDNNIKIGDFGTKKNTEGTLAYVHTIIGTEEYMANEVIQGQPYGQKADIYSLSRVFYQLVSLALGVHNLKAEKTTPLPTTTTTTIVGQELTEDDINKGNVASTPQEKVSSSKNSSTRNRNSNSNYRPTLEELLDEVPRTDIPKELKELIVKMGSDRPNERPEIRELVQHPLIRAAVLALPWSTVPKELLDTYGLTAADDLKLQPGYIAPRERNFQPATEVAPSSSSSSCTSSSSFSFSSAAAVVDAAAATVSSSSTFYSESLTAIYTDVEDSNDSSGNGTTTSSSSSSSSPSSTVIHHNQRSYSPPPPPLPPSSLTVIHNSLPPA